MSLSLKALEIAKSQLGKRESKTEKNWGSPVKEYLASVGINFPAPWCMAFVYWVFDNAANELKMENPLIKTGHVLTHWNKALPIYKKTTPKIGDIFIMDFGKGKGHTGIVLDVLKDDIVTIEGNSNDEGSREGYEVCSNKRKKSSIKGYLSYN